MSNLEQGISASNGGTVQNVRQTIISNAEKVYLDASASEIKLTSEEIADATKRYCQAMVNRYGKLEFLGVLTRRDEGFLPLDKIFVELKARRQAESGKLPRDWYRYKRSIEETLLEAETSASNEPALETQKIIADHPKVVLLGQPGSGKSTLLRYLALVMAQDNKNSPMPLFIPMADYVRRCSSNGQNLLDYLEIFVCGKFLYLDPPLSKAKDFFSHQLRNGHCLVLLDGFDEVTSLEERLLIRDEIEAFVAAFEGNHFVLTSRPAGYAEAALDTEKFQHFEIEDFTVEEIKLFLEKWYALREPVEIERREKIDSLLNAIENRPGLKRMAVNPLLLTIIALIHRQEAELPNQRVKLYEKSVDVLLGSWENIKGLQTWQITEEERRRRLEHLAYWMYQENILEKDRAVEVEKEELVRALANYLCKRYRDKDKVEALSEARSFLELIRDRTGLLVEKGRDIWGFVHLTFQEYLAAEDIFYRMNDSDEPIAVLRETILGHIHQPAWREVLLLTLSKLPPKRGSRALTIVIDANSEFEEILYRDLFFAASCLADDLSLFDIDEAYPIINGLVELAIYGNFRSLRNDAFTALAELRGSPYSFFAIEILINNLERNKKLDDDIRFSVAETIDKLGDIKTASQLYLDFANDERASSYHRISAARALYSINRSDFSTKILITIANNEAVESDYRLSSAQALSKCDQVESAVDIFFTIAQNRFAEDYTREEAINALGELEPTEKSTNMLTTIAQNIGMSERVRSAAIRVLPKVVHNNEELVKLLLSIIRENKTGDPIRRHAVNALAQIELDNIEITDTLLSVVQDKKAGNDVRISAIRAFSKDKQTELVINAFFSVLNDKSEAIPIRYNVARILGKLGHIEAVVEVLLSIIQDANLADYDRLSVAQMLNEFGQAETATDILQDIIDNGISDNPSYNLIRAVQILDKMSQTKIAGNYLLEILQNDQLDFDIRFRAAELLHELGQNEMALPYVRSFVQRPFNEDYQRCSILEKIGKFAQKTNKIEPEILQIISDLAENARVDNRTRSYAAQILGEQGQTESAIDILIFISQDAGSGIQTRINAFKALASLGQRQNSILGLRTTAEHEKSPYGRFGVAKVLSELGETKVAKNLFLSVSVDTDSNNHIKAKAFSELGQTETAINILLSIIQDDTEIDYYRRAALQTLVELGFPDEKDEILLLLQDEDIDISNQIEIAEALGKCGGLETAINILKSFAKNKSLDRYQRVQAARSLGELGQVETATKILLSIVKDDHKDNYSRDDAAEALGDLGPNQEVSEVLLAILNNEDIQRNIRIGAAKALGELGYVDIAIPYLASVIKYPLSSGIRHPNPLHLISRVSQGEPETLQTLLDLTQNDQANDYIRDYAYRTLKQLTLRSALTSD